MRLIKATRSSRHEAESELKFQHDPVIHCPMHDVGKWSFVEDWQPFWRLASQIATADHAWQITRPSISCSSKHVCDACKAPKPATVSCTGLPGQETGEYCKRIAANDIAYRGQREPFLACCGTKRASHVLLFENLLSGPSMCDLFRHKRVHSRVNTNEEDCS